jgi:hypothetical protein
MTAVGVGCAVTVEAAPVGWDATLPACSAARVARNRCQLKLMALFSVFGHVEALRDRSDPATNLSLQVHEK